MDRRQVRDTDVVETERLRLVPYSPEQILALIEDPELFNLVSAYPAAPGLREFYTSGELSKDYLDNLRRLDGPNPWQLGFAVVDRIISRVVGVGGFKGPANKGTVEIAYGIVPSHQGAGYATEVARALISFARADSTVDLIIAHTLPTRNASTSVLAKCGFVFTGEVDDPDDGRVWRWELRSDGDGSGRA
ncbi:MAG TPA: GNAT family protein [Gemmatimonadaceae bacterium]|nr:GNAT family protein [Gemmatimonadaceae bacterium]